MVNNNENVMFTVKNTVTLPNSFTHRLHLKGTLGDPEEYIDWIDTIRNAGPNDVIEFHLNTPGGNLYTAIELMNAFTGTEAHIHVVIAGLCASAGTILMTVGDSFEINPWTTFMFHNYSGGTLGKGNEMHLKMEYEREWSKRFMHEVYEGLLSGEEIDQLLDDRDFWLTAEDVSERLSKMIDYRAEVMQKAMEEAQKALQDALEEEAKPKKRGRPRKSTKKDSE